MELELYKLLEAGGNLALIAIGYSVLRLEVRTRILDTRLKWIEAKQVDL